MDCVDFTGFHGQTRVFIEHDEDTNMWRAGFSYGCFEGSAKFPSHSLSHLPSFAEKYLRDHSVGGALNRDQRDFLDRVGCLVYKVQQQKGLSSEKLLDPQFSGGMFAFKS